MFASNAPYITGNSLLSYLRQIFSNREVITSTEFRAFLQISAATDLRMRTLGKYPRVITVPGVIRDPRIMLIDLAAWLEQGGSPETAEKKPGKKRGRGSEAWKKNHPGPEAKAQPENPPAPKKEKEPEAASVPDAAAVGAEPDAPIAMLPPAGIEPDKQPGNPPDLPSANAMPVASEPDIPKKDQQSENPPDLFSAEAAPAATRQGENASKNQ